MSRRDSLARRRASRIWSNTTAIRMIAADHNEFQRAVDSLQVNDASLELNHGGTDKDTEDTAFRFAFNKGL